MDLNTLVDKAKSFSENVPEDFKAKATDFVEEQVEKATPDNLKDQAKDLVGGIKDKLGL